MKPARSLLVTLIRAQIALALALTLAVGMGALVSRAAQTPLSSMLYANRTMLRVRALGCPMVFGLCMPVDHALIDDLDRAQAVSSWSPDGQFIAAHFNQGWKLYRANCLLKGGECAGVPLETDTGVDMRVAWGPDGSAIAYTLHGGTTLRVRLRGCWTGGDCQTINFESGANMAQPSWSADGHFMAFSGAPHGFFMLHTDCLGNPSTCALSGIAAEPDQYWWPSLSHDGHSLLYNTYSNRTYQKVFLLDLISGTTRDLSPERDDAFQPAWDDSERYVAYVSPDGVGDDANLNVYLYDLARGLTAPAVVLPGNDTYPSWLPPGRAIG
jgi:Tol biopolymer transport system component